MNRIVLSAGHGKYVPGAVGILNEFDENCRVVSNVTGMLGELGSTVYPFVDNTSRTQNENLKTIVDYHNSKVRDLDVSIHFNSYQNTDKPMGTECLYVTQDKLSAQVSSAISHASGLLNRGGKKRTDLYFLNKTQKPAILIEVCFVDSTADAQLYKANFDQICAAVAQTISGAASPPVPAPPVSGSFSAKGKCSSFGGPDDTGVSPTEGLALISSIDQAPQLFLPTQPAGTSGLARRLNPWVHYLACRWDYSVTPKTELLKKMALVKASKTGIALKAFPADWGPNENTGRVADLSPSLMEDLGIKTDDEVEVTL